MYKEEDGPYEKEGNKFDRLKKSEKVSLRSQKDGDVCVYIVCVCDVCGSTKSHLN